MKLEHEQKQPELVASFTTANTQVLSPFAVQLQNIASEHACQNQSQLLLDRLHCLLS